MARVSLDTSVWTDRRFRRVAAKLGRTRYDVIARMAELWSVATEQERACLDSFTVDDVFEHEFVGRGLVACGLAFECKEHDECFLLAGSERLLWLAKKRQTARVNGRKGGRPIGKQKKPSSVSQITCVQEQEQEQEQEDLYMDLGAKNEAEPRILADAKRRAFDFESVYRLYPKKQSKQAGLKAARRTIKTQADFARFKKAVETIARSWSGHDPTYLPGFGPFMNGERWRDDDLPRPGADRNGKQAAPANSDELTLFKPKAKR